MSILYTLVLQLKIYRVKLTKESYIRVDTRELDGVSVIKCLPYIHLANGLCYTKPSLS